MKQRNYLVSYKLKNKPAVSLVLQTVDPACALGLVLDDLGDEADEPDAFEWLLIRSEKRPTPKKTTMRSEVKQFSRDTLIGPALPPEIMKAYYEGLS